LASRDSIAVPSTFHNPYLSISPCCLCSFSYAPSTPMPIMGTRRLEERRKDGRNRSAVDARCGAYSWAWTETARTGRMRRAQRGPVRFVDGEAGYRRRWSAHANIEKWYRGAGCKLGGSSIWYPTLSFPDPPSTTRARARAATTMSLVSVTQVRLRLYTREFAFR
jgi:hypothetical protein